MDFLTTEEERLTLRESAINYMAYGFKCHLKEQSEAHQEDCTRTDKALTILRYLIDQLQQHVDDETVKTIFAKVTAKDPRLTLETWNMAKEVRQKQFDELQEDHNHTI